MYAFTQRKHDPGKINKNNFLLHPENGNCKTRLAYEIKGNTICNLNMRNNILKCLKKNSPFYNFFQFYDLLYLKN